MDRREFINTAVAGAGLSLHRHARCAFASEAPVHWVIPSARARQAIAFTSEHLGT